MLGWEGRGAVLTGARGALSLTGGKPRGGHWVVGVDPGSRRPSPLTIGGIYSWSLEGGGISPAWQHTCVISHEKQNFIIQQACQHPKKTIGGSGGKHQAMAAPLANCFMRQLHHACLPPPSPATVRPTPAAWRVTKHICKHTYPSKRGADPSTCSRFPPIYSGRTQPQMQPAVRAVGPRRGDAGLRAAGQPPRTGSTPRRPAHGARVPCARLRPAAPVAQWWSRHRHVLGGCRKPSPVPRQQQRSVVQLLDEAV